ncbi:MAG: DUF5615 family PIN-like protein [Rubrobacteraceae bacterium]
MLFDENLNRRLKRFFHEDFDVMTVPERGWSDKRNGELLRPAEMEFDAILTTDKGTPHQQNLAGLELTVVLLRAKSNSYEDLAPLMEEAVASLNHAAPRTVTRIPAT